MTDTPNDPLATPTDVPGPETYTEPAYDEPTAEPAPEDAVDESVGPVGPNVVDEDDEPGPPDLPPGPLYQCENCGALLLQQEDGVFVTSTPPYTSDCPGVEGGGLHEVA